MWHTAEVLKWTGYATDQIRRVPDDIAARHGEIVARRESISAELDALEIEDAELLNQAWMKGHLVTERGLLNDQGIPM
jgi:hypothetical protein